MQLNEVFRKLPLSPALYLLIPHVPLIAKQVYLDIPFYTIQN